MPIEKGQNDNRMPLSSVVIPVYNVRDYLDRCLASVAAQDYPNIGIVYPWDEEASK